MFWHENAPVHSPYTNPAIWTIPTISMTSLWHVNVPWVTFLLHPCLQYVCPNILTQHCWCYYSRIIFELSVFWSVSTDCATQTFYPSCSCVPVKDCTSLQLHHLTLYLTDASNTAYSSTHLAEHCSCLHKLHRGNSLYRSGCKPVTCLVTALWWLSPITWQ